MFEELKGKLGFGCMRLPMIGDEVDEEQFKAMVDHYMEQGFNYFDTAHGYIEGKSEKAIKNCLTSRYDRDQYLLVDKLTEPYFSSEEEIRPFFESQLELCGVDYFDFYLMHAQNARNFEHFKKHKAYETATALKEEGKIRHLGISFHDSAEVLDKILTEYPQIEVVQLQFNYLDYEDPMVQSKKCWETARKHGKKVLVMEPVKGGTLANLPDQIKVHFDELNNPEASYASYAIRFAAGHEDVIMVLSGMSTLEQMKDNASFMQDLQPLTEREMEAITRIRDTYAAQNLIGCTACKYCVEGCPKQIPIPNVFSAFNAHKQFQPERAKQRFAMATKGKGVPSECIKCRKCEKICPQMLPITDLLEEASAVFES